MRVILRAVCAVLVLLSTYGGVWAQHRAHAGALHWTLCTMVRATGDQTCRTYAMPKHHVSYGTIHFCTESRAYTWCRTVPRLKRPYVTVRLWITGYSYGVACGDVNGITADGSVPGVGDVASDNPAYWHRRIYVPSLKYAGYVNDRGVGTGGMDLFAPSCGATFAYTGWRDVRIYSG